MSGAILTVAGPMALIIVEDWKFQAEDWAQTVFSNTVERNAERFGKDVGDVGIVSTLSTKKVWC